MTGTISSRFANFIAMTPSSAIPASVRHDARRAILNNFAAGFGGCRDVAIDAMLAVVGPETGPRIASVIGRPEKLGMLDAAWLNAAIANVLDFDDTHLATVIHPTSPIAPALLAFAEHRAAVGRPISGAALTDAFVVGVEVCCRIGNAMSPGHYNRGWHITGTCGVLGAAAGVARLKGLDAECTNWALANAATQASGLVETLGFHAKSLNPASAARNGLLSALLAARGLSGPARPIEGPRGFFAVMSDSPDLSGLTDRFGETWEISLNALKPYPCGVVLHPVIDACLELRAAGRTPPLDQIESIIVRGNSLLKARADRRVTTGREAQVCLPHSVAVALLLGRAGPAEYTDALVNDSDVCAIGAKVVMHVDDDVPTEAAGVTVVRNDGVRLAEIYVSHARGSLGRPLTDAEVEAKLRAQAALNAPGVNCDKLIETVWSLDRQINAAEAIASSASP